VKGKHERQNDGKEEIKAKKKNTGEITTHNTTTK
jgi:hypothetical protein